ncbi:hypothetical protein HYT58_01960 [Candidatus Woesearchaeota archaeon]|nr:hypothetical protein [Candidatus Woesearchaeota archaeon]
MNKKGFFFDTFVVLIGAAAILYLLYGLFFLDSEYREREIGGTISDIKKVYDESNNVLTENKQIMRISFKEALKMLGENGGFISGDCELYSGRASLYSRKECVIGKEKAIKNFLHYFKEDFSSRLDLKDASYEFDAEFVGGKLILTGDPGNQTRFKKNNVEYERYLYLEDEFDYTFDGYSILAEFINDQEFLTCLANFNVLTSENGPEECLKDGKNQNIDISTEEGVFMFKTTDKSIYGDVDILFALDLNNLKN